MFATLRTRLTYANVTGTLALFAALGGGAVAIGGVTNSEGEIQACYDKKGANRGDVRLLVKGKCNRRTEKRIEWSQQGPPGPQGEPGRDGAPGAPGEPGAPATKLWADVDNTNAGPTLVRGSGVSGVASAGTGEVRVTFNQDVSGCAYQATGWLNSDGAGGSTFSDPPIMAVERGSAAPTPGSAVDVHAYSHSTGNLDFNGYDFSLAVFC